MSSKKLPVKFRMILTSELWSYRQLNLTASLLALILRMFLYRVTFNFVVSEV